MLRTFNERSFYKLTWLRFKALSRLDGLAPLVYLYFCDRAGRKLGAASWESYAKDCCPGMTAERFRGITRALISVGELQAQRQEAGQWRCLPNCRAMLGADADGNFLRFTSSLRRWLGAQLVPKKGLVRGRLFHVLLHSIMLADDPAQRGHGKSWAALAAHASLENMITAEQYRWCAKKLHKKGCLTIQKTKGGRHVLKPNLPVSINSLVQTALSKKIAQRNEQLDQAAFVAELAQV